MKHTISRVEDDDEGYGDGLSDHYECSCGLVFDEVQYSGAEEAFEHLESLLP